jgi:hypothetical protein
MKRVIGQLRVGDRVQVEVIENDGPELIVSVSGDLVRVVDQTGSRLRRGARVGAIVTAIEPLAFRLDFTSRIRERIG